MPKAININLHGLFNSYITFPFINIHDMKMVFDFHIFSFCVVFSFEFKSFSLLIQLKLEL